jgi:hypothetical protein
MRTTGMVMLAALALAVPAGCGDDDEPATGDDANETAVDETTETADDETTETADDETTETDGTGGGQQGFRAELEPLNSSGVSGTAIFSQLGRTLRVQVTAASLEPQEEHAQHLHRLEDGAPGECPTEVQDENGDGVISDQEGETVYGPVALELAPFPTADADGDLSFQGTFDIDAELEPLSDRVIVLHGIELGGEYDATVPVACARLG